MVLGKDTRFLDSFVFGMWQTNCFILGDLDLGAAVVVDPGQDAAAAVRARLAERGVRCDALLLTHGHIDHAWSVPELARDLDAPVFLHPGDRWLWDNPVAAFDERASLAALEQQFGLRWEPPDDRLNDLRDGQRLTFAGCGVEVRHTPGHTPGSSVFLLTDTGADEPLLLSGDLIFAGSVGRTDFPRGSWEDQMASIARVVLPLDDRTRILSGHGPETNVGAERRTNPFLREIV
jgi:hydroxyacylglutathione hydrolase